MPKTTTSIAGRAHGASVSPTPPQTKQYRPQLSGLPGVHPEVARAVQTSFDNQYTLRAQVQRMEAAMIAAGAKDSGGTMKGGSSSSSGNSNAKSNTNDNILGLKYKAGTDSASLPHAGTPVYNQKEGQFEFATPAGFVAPPASASSPGVKGQISHDGANFYVCVGENSWAKTSLSSF